LLLLSIAATAQAHHSFSAQYDRDQTITLTGVITKVEWMNPHVYFYIDVTDAKTGQVESWAVEMGPPHMLQRTGWKKNAMKIGDVVEVSASRARDGSHSVNASKVTLTATGQVLGSASSAGQTITSGTAGQQE
jgi:hypothetical protein